MHAFESFPFPPRSSLTRDRSLTEPAGCAGASRVLLVWWRAERPAQRAAGPGGAVPDSGRAHLPRVFAGIHPNPACSRFGRRHPGGAGVRSRPGFAVGGGSVIDAARPSPWARRSRRLTCGTSGWASARWSAPAGGGSAHHLRRRERDQLLRRAHRGLRTAPSRSGGLTSGSDPAPALQ